MSWSDLVSELAQLLQNPGENPRRTAIAAAFVFVLFMTVVVAALIFLPESDEEEMGEREPEADGGDTRGKRRLSSLIMGVGMVVMVLLIVGVIGVGDHYSRDTRLCARCHVPSGAVESWQASTHPSVECIVCHGGSGLMGGLELRLRGVQNALATGRQTGASTLVGVDYQACASCHVEDLDGTRSWNNVRVRHAEFVDGIPCAQCHGRVGHQPAGVTMGALPRSIMSTCADCHDGATADRACTTCHERDFALASIDSGGLAKVDLPGPSTCKGCHDLTGCTNCHGIEMPHPPDWGDPKVHAPQGAFDTAVCIRCHDRGCTECHRGIHDNHGADWKQTHSENPDGSWCTQRCHDADKVGKNMCALCHTNR